MYYISAAFSSATAVHNDFQSFEQPLESRSVQDCITGETGLPGCFGGAGQIPQQNLNVSDIAYLGNELRNIDKTQMARGVYAFVGIAADNITDTCKVNVLLTHNTAKNCLAAPRPDSLYKCAGEGHFRHNRWHPVE